MSELKRRWIMLIKWTWLLTVLGTAIKYLHDHHDAAQLLLVDLPLQFMLVSVLLLLITKLLLAQNARIAARHFGANAPYQFFFHAYNLSQLGKYLPGSVWQFIGRYAIYRSHGFTIAQSRDAMIAETTWVLGGATVAAGLVLTAPRKTVYETFGSIPHFAITMILSMLIITILIVLLVSIWKSGNAIKRLAEFFPPLDVFLLQIITWLILGLSFWLLVSPVTNHTINPVFAIGLFGLSYATGFLVPLAPAGIGVREGVLVAGLTGSVTVEQAVVIAIVARVLYVLVELILVLLSLCWNTLSKSLHSL